MTNLPFTPGIGRLATDFYDFLAHINGTEYRQNASTINTDNPSLIYGEATTVEAALENISAYLTAAADNGQGFITVGDGYNTYANANGTINYDNAVPSLDTILNPLFAEIIAFQNSYTPVPSAYTRVQDGGVVVIKAGTYIVKNTILVPPGITILGEGYGTKIVNATNLNTSVMPPIVNISGSGSPVFEIAADPNRSQDDAAIDPSMFMFARETRIWNLVICDNFVEPTLLGDSYYKLPQNKSGNTPLIQQDNGSNLSLYGVFLMGRVSFSSGTVVSACTTFAVQLNASLAAKYGTICSIDKCFIDGFSVPIQWSSTGDTITPVNRDFLTITNSKIRGYGYLTGDSSAIINNSIIVMNDNNANIINNYVYGNASNIQSLVAMINHLPTSPNFQARSKINVSTNNIEIDRTNNLFNSIFVPLYIASDFTNYSSTLAIGNNFQDQNVIGPVVAQASIILNSQSPYTIPNIGAGSTDYILMAVPGSSPGEGVIVNLPPIEVAGIATNANRVLIIKAMCSTNSSSPVTIQANGSDTIEFNGPSSYVITVPFTSITLFAFNVSGSNFWAII